jgi:excisionase family DNA binding protein
MADNSGAALDEAVSSATAVTDERRQAVAKGSPLHAAGEAAGQVRPERVAVAIAAVNAVRSEDPGAIAAALLAGPEGPYWVAEVAVALDVSKSTIYKAVESGELAALRFGNTRKGTIRVPHGALVQYVAACAAAAVTRPGASSKRRSLVVEIRDASQSVHAGVA